MFPHFVAIWCIFGKNYTFFKILVWGLKVVQNSGIGQNMRPKKIQNSILAFLPPTHRKANK